MEVHVNKDELFRKVKTKRIPLQIFDEFVVKATVA